MNVKKYKLNFVEKGERAQGVLVIGNKQYYFNLEEEA